jgi:epoxide hydrolase-like predicted phosphatase
VIKNIIFDLGNVLVKVDFARSEKLLLNAGVRKKSFDRFFRKRLRIEFESGKITTSEFMDMAYRELGGKVSKTKLTKLFTEMFDEISEMKKFLRKLHRSGKYRLFLMSNTNPLHFNYARKNFPYINLFHKFILSYKVGFTKPDRRIYMTLLKRYNLHPAESLFIDDQEANCLAAKRLGIKTIIYKDYYSFIKKFRNITDSN